MRGKTPTKAGRRNESNSHQHISGPGSFILTIFSAIYLNQRHVDMLIEQMQKRFDAKFDGIDAKFDGLRAEMRAEFGTVRAALGNLNQRVDPIQT